MYFLFIPSLFESFLMASLGRYAGTVGKKSLNLTAAGTLYDASVTDVSYLLLFINCSEQKKTR